jgi:hypothetical protein
MPAMTARSDSLSDDDLERALRESRALVDAPEHVIQRALAAFTTHRHASSGTRLRERLAAVLTFDSGGASPLAFGLRSSGGAVRQLLFTLDGCDIDLRVAPAEQAHCYALSGQVFGPDSSGVVVMQSEDGASRSEVALSELGEFRLPSVPAGAYRLTLELAHGVVELPLVRIPHAP